MNIRGGGLVIRLVNAAGEEVDGRTVVRQGNFAFVVVAAGELQRFGRFVGCGRDVNRPDVLVPLEIQITLVIIAVDGTSNDVNVGFPIAFGVGLGRRTAGVRAAGFAVILLTLFLSDIFRWLRTQKPHAPPV